MDGLYNYKVQEPIFREYLRQQLSGMARDYVFLCETNEDCFARTESYFVRQLWSRSNSNQT